MPFNPYPESGPRNNNPEFKGYKLDQFDQGKYLYIWEDRGDIEKHKITDNSPFINNGNLEIKLEGNNNPTTIQPDTRIKLTRIEPNEDFEDPSTETTYEIADYRLSDDGEEIEYLMEQFDSDGNSQGEELLPESLVLAMKETYSKKQDLESLRQDIETKEADQIDDVLDRQQDLSEELLGLLEDIFSKSGRKGEDYSDLENRLQNIHQELESIELELQNIDDYQQHNFDHYYHKPTQEEFKKENRVQNFAQELDNKIEQKIIRKARAKYSQAETSYNNNIDVNNMQNFSTRSYVRDLGDYYRFIGKGSDMSTVNSIINNNSTSDNQKKNSLRPPIHDPEDEVRNLGFDHSNFSDIRNNVANQVFSEIENSPDGVDDFLEDEINQKIQDILNDPNYNYNSEQDVKDNEIEEILNEVFQQDYQENPNDKEEFDFEQEQQEMQDAFENLKDQAEDILNDVQGDVSTNLEQELRDYINELDNKLTHINDWNDLMEYDPNQANQSLEDLQRQRLNEYQTAKRFLAEDKVKLSELEIRIAEEEISPDTPEEKGRDEVVEFESRALREIIEDNNADLADFAEDFAETIAQDGDRGQLVDEVRSWIDTNQQALSPDELEEINIYDWDEFVDLWENEIAETLTREKFEPYIKQLMRQEISRLAEEAENSGKAGTAGKIAALGGSAVTGKWAGGAAAGGLAAAVGVGGTMAAGVGITAGAALGTGAGLVMGNSITSWASEKYREFKRGEADESLAGKIGDWLQSESEEDRALEELEIGYYEEETMLHLINETIVQETSSEIEVDTTEGVATVDGANRSYYERDIKNLDKDPENPERTEALELITKLDLNSSEQLREMQQELAGEGIGEVEAGEHRQAARPEVAQQIENEDTFIDKAAASIDQLSKARQGEYSKLATMAAGSGCAAGYQFAYYAGSNVAGLGTLAGGGAMFGAASGWNNAEQKLMREYQQKQEAETRSTINDVEGILDGMHANNRKLRPELRSRGISDNDFFGNYYLELITSAANGFYTQEDETRLKGLIRDLEKTELIQEKKEVSQLLESIEDNRGDMREEVENELDWKSKGWEAFKGAATGALAAFGIGESARAGVETADATWDGEDANWGQLYTVDAVDQYFGYEEQEAPGLGQSQGEGWWEQYVDNPSYGEASEGTEPQPEEQDPKSKPEGTEPRDSDPKKEKIKPESTNVEVMGELNIEQGSSMIEELEQLWGNDENLAEDLSESEKNTIEKNQIREQLHKEYGSFEEFKNKILKDVYKMEKTADGSSWKHSMMLHPDADTVVVDTPDGPTVRFVDDPNTAVQEVEKFNEYHTREVVKEGGGDLKEVDLEDVDSGKANTDLDIGGDTEGTVSEDDIHRLDSDETGESPTSNRIEILELTDGRKVILEGNGEPVPKDTLPPIEEQPAIEELKQEYSETQSEGDSGVEPQVEPYQSYELGDVGSVQFYENPDTSYSKLELDISDNFDLKTRAAEIFNQNTQFNLENLSTDGYETLREMAALDQLYQEMYPSNSTPIAGSNDALVYNEVQTRVLELASTEGNGFDYNDLNSDFIDRYGLEDQFVDEAMPDLIADEPSDYAGVPEEGADTGGANELNLSQQEYQDLRANITSELSQVNPAGTGSGAASELLVRIDELANQALVESNKSNLAQFFENGELNEAEFLNSQIENSDRFPKPVWKEYAKSLVNVEFGGKDFDVGVNTSDGFGDAIAIKDSASGTTHFILEQNKNVKFGRYTAGQQYQPVVTVREQNSQGETIGMKVFELEAKANKVEQGELIDQKSSTAPASGS